MREEAEGEVIALRIPRECMMGNGDIEFWGYFMQFDWSIIRGKLHTGPQPLLLVEMLTLIFIIKYVST